MRGISEEEGWSVRPEGRFVESPRTRSRWSGGAHVEEDEGVVAAWMGEFCFLLLLVAVWLFMLANNFYVYML
jgi:hypothetical protein